MEIPPIFKVVNPLAPSNNVLCSPIGSSTTTLVNWGNIITVNPPGRFNNGIGVFSPGVNGTYKITLIINYQCPAPIRGSFSAGIFGQGRTLASADFRILTSGRSELAGIVELADRVIVEVPTKFLSADDTISTFISANILTMGGMCIDLKTSEWTITKL